MPSNGDSTWQIYRKTKVIHNHNSYSEPDVFDRSATKITVADGVSRKWLKKKRKNVATKNI